MNHLYMSILYLTMIFYGSWLQHASAMSNQRVAVVPKLSPQNTRCPSCQRPCRQIWHQLVLSHPEIRTNWVKILGAQNNGFMDGWFQVYFYLFFDNELVFVFFFWGYLWWRWFVDALCHCRDSSYNVFVPWLLDEAIAMRFFPGTIHCGFLKSQRAARWLSPKFIWSVGIIIPFSIHFWVKKI